MAFNRFEQSLVDQYTSTQFPDLPPEPESAIDGSMQLAAGPSDTVSDAGTPVIRVGRAGVRYRPPSMKDITEPLGGLMDMGAATLKGVTQGFTGLPGDLEGLARTVINLMGGKVDENTVMPTTDEVKAWLDKFPMARVGDGKNPYESIGEVGAPGGQIKAGKEVVRGITKGAKAIAPMIPKNVPVGASTEVVGGTQAMLQAGKATAPVSDIGFYSAVEDAALNIQRKSGSGQAMLNDINKAANVKADEIKWIGLDEFLKGKKNVTREEVQDFIAQNKVDVQEVQLGGAYKNPYPYTTAEEWQGAINRAEASNNWDEANRLNQAWEAYEGFGPAGATKFGAYTLPGGENYREILLTMPTQFERMSKPLETEIRALGLNQNLGDISLRDLIDAGASADLQNRFERAMRGSAESSYHSSHWDQPNVLAHIRVNDRVDADGKKMLLVEEVQSDWHQAGRDKGYATADISTRLKESEKELEQIGLQIRGLNNRMARLSDADLDEFNKLADERQKLYDRQGVLMDEGNALIDRRNAGVPDAPMKDTWYQLALKRVLKYAADNGYERVGLTTGSRQAERYDLSKQIDSIEYSKNSNGTIDFAATKNNSTVFDRTMQTPEQIESMVGKEIASKIFNSPDGFGSLTGIDLQVGGEGMKKYYDEVYPQFLAKYGKKWGAKVGETRIETEQSPKSWAYFRDWFAANHGDVGGSSTALAQWESGEKSKYVREFLKQNKAQESVRYIDITPQMRESVGKGQPLFTATGLGTGAATMQDEENK